MTINKCFIVLGMHRSATSLTAKGLHESGVNIGSRLIPADWSNKHGHWEDTDFVNLNKEIFKYVGAEWYDPPSVQQILDPDVKYNFDAKIQALIKDKQHGLWGWKDPRTAFTIDLFLPYIENPHFIYNLREPMEVAKSLNKRNQIPIDTGMALSVKYNERILGFIIGWLNAQYKTGFQK